MFEGRGFIPPLHPEGRGIAAASLLAAVVLSLWSTGLALIAVGGAVWAWRVYAAPSRVAPDAQPGLVIAPADGTVAEIGEGFAPVELDMGDQPLMRVTVVSGVFDSHVVRSPAEGVIERVEFRGGRLGDALAPAAVLEHERNGLRVRLDTGATLGIVQISGRALPRLSWSVVENQRIEAGRIYGVSRLGGRVDLYLPAGSTLTVRPGQKMVAGETMLARIP